MKFDESIRYQYDLKPDSVVFDIGGFKGEFSQNILNKFGCRPWCFEPVFEIKNKDFRVFDYGLGAMTDVISIRVDDNKTGRFCKSGTKREVVIIDIVSFLKNHEIKNIDLMKINIEGMEYELLQRLIESGFIRIIDNIQVQFHNVTTQSDEQMWKIQKALTKTHGLTWQFRYVWENWQRYGNIHEL